MTNASTPGNSERDHLAVSFETPEQAALAEWPDQARARVVSTQIVGNRAEVALDTDPHYPYWGYCVRDSEGWHEAVSGNGPIADWDDPETFGWDEDDRGDA